MEVIPGITTTDNTWLGMDPAGNILLLQGNPGLFANTVRIDFSLVSRDNGVRTLRDTIVGFAQLLEIGFDDAGNAYVTDVQLWNTGPDTGRVQSGGIWMVPADPAAPSRGLVNWVSGSPDRLAPAWLTLGRDSAFYFIDLFTGDLVRLTATRRDVLARGVLAVDNLFAPEALAIAADADGRVYVVRRTAVYRAGGGALVLHAGSPLQGGTTDGSGADARFTQARSVTIDRDGNLFVGDGSSIRKVTPAGRVSTIVGATENGLGAIGRVAVGDDGTLAATMGPSLVRVRFG